MKNYQAIKKLSSHKDDTKTFIIKNYCPSYFGLQDGECNAYTNCKRCWDIEVTKERIPIIRSTNLLEDRKNELIQIIE